MFVCAGGSGVLTVPCGVVTHAGRHTATLCYTNNTVIASTSTHVAWPSLAITVPTRCSCQLSGNRELQSSAVND